MLRSLRTWKKNEHEFGYFVVFNTANVCIQVHHLINDFGFHHVKISQNPIIHTKYSAMPSVSFLWPIRWAFNRKIGCAENQNQLTWNWSLECILSAFISIECRSIANRFRNMLVIRCKSCAANVWNAYTKEEKKQKIEDLNVASLVNYERNMNENGSHVKRHIHSHRIYL